MEHVLKHVLTVLCPVLEQVLRDTYGVPGVSCLPSDEGFLLGADLDCNTHLFYLLSLL